MHDIGMQFADLLKNAREKQGVSQKELGLRMGVEQPAVSRFEQKGIRSISTLQEALEALDVHMIITVVDSSNMVVVGDDDGKR